MADRRIRKRDCVRLSNRIIERCQLALPAVSRIGDIRSNLFVSLLEVLTQRLPPGIIPNPATTEDEVHNVQTIINHIALDLINVDLSHISGERVMGGDPRAIYNLLEIFCGLHKYLSSHEIDKWHLEESLTETEEELSSTGSSTPTDSPSVEQDDDPTPAAAEALSLEATPNDTVVEPTSTSAAGGGPQTPQEGATGALEADSLGVKSSGSSAGAVSFPESQYSLELELPISTSGTREPREHRTHAADLASTTAAASSSSRETRQDETTSPEDETTPPEDETTPEDVQSPPVDEMWEDGGSAAMAVERERGATGSQETSEGRVEGGSLETESGERTERSTDSAAQDSPTTETEETPESQETEEPAKTTHEPHHFQFIDEQTPTDEDAVSEDETEPEDGEEDQEDISRQLSQEMQKLQWQAMPQEKMSDGAEKKERKRSSVSPSSDTGAPRQRPGRSAPCQGAPSRRHRSSERSSASDPGVNGPRPCRRLLTRNIETIAEIHESGGERAVTRTTREQTGHKLCKETVQREVRRKVHSAPQPRLMSFLSRQSSRRSVGTEGVLHWLESQMEDASLKVEGQDTDVFEFLRREFPYVRVSDETKRKLLLQYRQQMQYILHLVQPTENRKYHLRRADVLRRQALLTDIIRQQQQHDQRFRRQKSSRLQAIKERNGPRDAKIACLRAKRFVDSFKQQFESRAALNRSREELLMKAVFEEMLEIQRHRLRAVRALEKRAIRDFYGDDGYTSDLNRMHQFYEANFRDLAQMLSREKNDLAMSQKQQTRLADRIKREFRAYMEADVRSLNDKVATSWQPQYRELDADRIRSDLYEAHWRFCVS